MKIVRRFLEGEVHNWEEGEMAPKSREKGEMAPKSREEGEIGEKVGRREIYPPVRPPFSSACILNKN